MVASSSSFASASSTSILPGRFGFPIIGETLSFYAPFHLIQLHPFIRDRIQLYGTTFRSSVLGSKCVFTTDKSIANEVLKHEWTHFHLSYPSFVKKLIGTFITSTNEEEWKLHRQAVTVFIQQNLRQRLFQSLQHNIIQEISTWDNTIKLLHKTKKMTFNLAFQAMLDDVPLPKTLFDDFSIISKYMGSLPINIPGTNYNKALKARSNFVHHLESLISKSNSEFVDVLLSRGVNHKTIPDIIAGILFAASDTTGTMMGLCVKFIKDNPEVFQMLKHEHAKLEHKKVLSWDDYKFLTFTHNVVLEALRCASPAYALFRKALTNIELSNGYIVPKGWNMVISTTGLHFDPTTFTDPSVFNPWRWEVTDTKNLFAFGGGPRTCPGMEVAVVEITIFLYHFLGTIRRWDEIGEMNIVLDGTIKVENGLCIRLYKY